MLRGDFKRKRRDIAAGKVIKVYSASSRPYKKRKFIPGVDRTGGYYGRFAGRNAELKFHDVDLDDVIIAAGSNITPSINIIPQGVKENERVGRKCTIKSINWVGTLALPVRDAQALPSPGDEIRIILYLDKQANGAAATRPDLLSSPNTDSFRNLANSSRFQFLYDKVWLLDYGSLASDTDAVVSSNGVQKRLKFYKKVNIPIEYDNTADTGVLTTIRQNNLGVLLEGSQSVCGLTSKFRLRFSDS